MLSGAFEVSFLVSLEYTKMLPVTPVFTSGLCANTLVNTLGFTMLLPFDPVDAILNRDWVTKCEPVAKVGNW